MRNTFLLFSFLFFISCCNNKKEDLLINIAYIGKQDKPVPEIIIINYSIDDKKYKGYFKNTYKTNDNCSLVKIQDYLEKNVSSDNGQHKSMIKIIFGKQNKQQVRYYKGNEALQVISFIENNFKLSEIKKNQFTNDIARIKYALEIWR